GQVGALVVTELAPHLLRDVPPRPLLEVRRGVGLARVVGVGRRGLGPVDALGALAAHRRPRHQTRPPTRIAAPTNAAYVIGVMRLIRALACVFTSSFWVSWSTVSASWARWTSISASSCSGVGCVIAGPPSRSPGGARSGSAREAAGSGRGRGRRWSARDRSPGCRRGPRKSSVHPDDVSSEPVHPEGCHPLERPRPQPAVR